MNIGQNWHQAWIVVIIYSLVWHRFLFFASLRFHQLFLILRVPKTKKVKLISTGGLWSTFGLRELTLGHQNLYCSTKWVDKSWEVVQLKFPLVENHCTKTFWRNFNFLDSKVAINIKKEGWKIRRYRDRDPIVENPCIKTMCRNYISAS